MSSVTSEEEDYGSANGSLIITGNINTPNTPASATVDEVLNNARKAFMCPGALLVIWALLVIQGALLVIWGRF